jgi:hypothetical protein
LTRSRPCKYKLLDFSMAMALTLNTVPDMFCTLIYQYTCLPFCSTPSPGTNRRVLFLTCSHLCMPLDEASCADLSFTLTHLSLAVPLSYPLIHTPWVPTPGCAPALACRTLPGKLGCVRWVPLHANCGFMLGKVGCVHWVPHHALY